MQNTHFSYSAPESHGSRSRSLGLHFLALLFPAPEHRISRATSQLDVFVAVYRFNELHSLRMQGTPSQVFQAIERVTASDIRLFRLLVWLRRFGRSGPEDMLSPSDSLPILDVATRTTFIYLAKLTPRELVVGTYVAKPPDMRVRPTSPSEFQTMTRPGVTKAAMNFHARSHGNSSMVTTETRVFATDDRTRRRFAAYWRLILPGSALIRRSWLKAIKKEVETAVASGRIATADRTDPHVGFALVNYRRRAEYNYALLDSIIHRNGERVEHDGHAEVAERTVDVDVRNAVFHDDAGILTTPTTDGKAAINRWKRLVGVGARGEPQSRTDQEPHTVRYNIFIRPAA